MCRARDPFRGGTRILAPRARSDGRSDVEVNAIVDAVFLLGQPPMKLPSILIHSPSNDELLQLAECHAKAQGWPWIEPVAIQRGFFRIRIMTNCNCRCGNVSIVVSRYGGRIVSAGFASR